MAGALALAGCEAPADRPAAKGNSASAEATQSGDAAADQAPQIRIANEYHERLSRLPPNLQRLTMMRAIRDAGNRCQRVDNAGYQQEYRNMRMWVAVCGVESKNWTVFVAPNGDIQVRDCADAGRLSLPRCEPLPPPVPDEQPTFKQGAADNAFKTRGF
jgi:hypothetical protein